MKILYAITKSNWGGSQRYVFDLATAAHARGMDVVVAHGPASSHSTSGEGELAKRLRDADIRTISLPIENRASLSAILAAKRSLEVVFEREQPDIVHLNSSLVGVAGVLAARKTCVPYTLFTDHGWMFKEARSLPVQVITWLISWFTALLADKIIAVSDDELRLTKQMPFVGHKAVRIYNGIDLNMQFGSGEIIRNAFPRGVHITGTVGELTKNKNQIALIEQAKNDPTMYVAIVGGGELRPLLEQQIEEYGLETRVKLFGFQPAADVMKGFDIFALPSIKEALGYVILEARLAGLPIKANPVGGIPEAMNKPLSEFSKETMIEKTLALY